MIQHWALGTVRRWSVRRGGTEINDSGRCQKLLEWFRVSTYLQQAIFALQFFTKKVGIWRGDVLNLVFTFYCFLKVYTDRKKDERRIFIGGSFIINLLNLYGWVGP